jgi:hypothetical protein
LDHSGVQVFLQGLSFLPRDDNIAFFAMASCANALVAFVLLVDLVLVVQDLYHSLLIIVTSILINAG